MKNCVGAVVVWLLSALIAPAADTAVAVDPMAWTESKTAPLFVERVARGDFAARFARARQRADVLAAERAKLPAHGLFITYIPPGHEPAAAGMLWGDICLTLDGKALLNSDELPDALDRPRTLTYFSRAHGEQKLELNPGFLGFKVREFDRDNPLLLNGDWRHSPWADEVRVAGLICEEDPDLAETALAHAVTAGLPVDLALEKVATEMAFYSAHYEEAMQCAQRGLNRAVPAEKETFRTLFLLSALSCYKLEAALQISKQSENVAINEYVPNLERLIAAHKFLPDEKRLAASPSERAHTLFHDDMMVRASQYQPGDPNAWFFKRNNQDAYLDELSALKPAKLITKVGEYSGFTIIQGVSNAYVSCRFTVAPSTEKGKGNSSYWLTFKFKPHKRPEKVDALHPLVWYSAQIQVGKDQVLTSIMPTRTFIREYWLRPFDRSPAAEHHLEMYVVDGRVETWVDGRRVVYAPLDMSPGPLDFEFAYASVTVDFREFTFCELLTPDERKRRVDPNVNAFYRFGWTRLHRMVQWAPLEWITPLLHAGAMLDLPDQGERTPLILAAQKNRLDVVKLLVTKGAKIDWLDAQGKNAYMHAQELGFKELAEYLIKLNPELGKVGKAIKPPKPPPDQF